jgi:selenocysteine lyase/cysteine desulfurase
MIYLDSAATSLIRPKSVYSAVMKSLRDHAGYARSGHRAALSAGKEIYSCRCAAAELFNLDKPENVVFCQNATHALNTAIFGLYKNDTAAVISGYEHNAVLRPLCELERQGKIEIVKAQSPLFDGDAAVKAFEQAFEALDKRGKKCGLCVCTMVSNVFGFILPVDRIGRLCADRGTSFIVDASQAAGSVEVDVKKIGADVICAPGHKGLLGPPGTGLMLLCSGRLPKPYMFGGTGSDSKNVFQPEFAPERYESGTQNIAGICGLGAGIAHVMENREKILRHERMICGILLDGLTEISGVKVFGLHGNQAGLLSFCVDGTDSEYIAEKLAEKNIAVRGGLHCAPLAHETAGTLEQGTVRLSPCGESTVFEAKTALKEIKCIVNSSK